MIIGIKSGTFTILTKGHIECLKFCKEHCDYLTVVINDDDYLVRKKGFCAVPLAERTAVLESIKYVDEVISYSGNNENEMVKAIAKKWKDTTQYSNSIIIAMFHALGTHSKDSIPGSKYADRIIFCPNTESSSSSDIMKRIYVDIGSRIGKNEKV